MSEFNARASQDQIIKSNCFPLFLVTIERLLLLSVLREVVVRDVRPPRYIDFLIFLCVLHVDMMEEQRRSR